jgi:HlyD family secretion protein
VNTTDGTLQRINSHLEPSRPIPIGGSPTAVAVGGGSVWVTDTSSSSVVKVNPRTFQATRLAVGNNPVAVTFGADRVWVANAADGTVTVLKDGTPTTTRVEIGAVGPTLTQVTSGLSTGDEVMLADLTQPLPTATTGGLRGIGGGGARPGG